MIANETTINWSSDKEDVSNYRPPFGFNNENMNIWLWVTLFLTRLSRENHLLIWWCKADRWAVGQAAATQCPFINMKTLFSNLDMLFPLTNWRSIKFSGLKFSLCSVLEPFSSQKWYLLNNWVISFCPYPNPLVLFGGPDLQLRFL